MAIDRPPILPKKKNENRSFYDDLFRNACFGTDACDVIDQSSESSRVEHSVYPVVVCLDHLFHRRVVEGSSELFTVSR